MELSTFYFLCGNIACFFLFSIAHAIEHDTLTQGRKKLNSRINFWKRRILILEKSVFPQKEKATVAQTLKAVEDSLGKCIDLLENVKNATAEPKAETEVVEDESSPEVEWLSTM